MWALFRITWQHAVATGLQRPVHRLSTQLFLSEHRRLPCFYADVCQHVPALRGHLFFPARGSYRSAAGILLVCTPGTVSWWASAQRVTTASGAVCVSRLHHTPKASQGARTCLRSATRVRGVPASRPCTNTVCFALGFIFVIFPPGNLLASSRNEQGSVTALTLDRPTQWPCDYAGGVRQGEATIAVWHLLLHWVLFWLCSETQLPCLGTRVLGAPL